jgi:hypothetical protein
MVEGGESSKGITTAKLLTIFAVTAVLGFGLCTGTVISNGNSNLAAGGAWVCVLSIAALLITLIWSSLVRRKR